MPKEQQERATRLRSTVIIKRDLNADGNDRERPSVTRMHSHLRDMTRVHGTRIRDQGRVQSCPQKVQGNRRRNTLPATTREAALCRSHDSKVL